MHPTHHVISAAIALLSVATLCAPARADEPRAMMDLDRSQPGFSSRTVGRGHVQIESGITIDRLGYSVPDIFPNDQFTRTAVETVVTARVRLGLSERLELSAGTGLFSWWRSTEPSGRDQFERAQTTLGLRWHALDGEGAAPSLGLMFQGALYPAGSVDGNANIEVSPRLHILTDWALPANLTLRANLAVSATLRRNGWDMDNLPLITSLGVPIGESLRAFVSLEWQLAVDDLVDSLTPRPALSAQWQLTDALALDAALRWTPDAFAYYPSYGPGGTLGLSARW